MKHKRGGSAHRLGEGSSGEVNHGRKAIRTQNHHRSRSSTRATIGNARWHAPGVMAVDFEERDQLPAAAPLSSGPHAPGTEELRSRRDPDLRRQQHPLHHEHEHRRMGARQDVPLRAARRRRLAASVGFRLGRGPSPAPCTLARARALPCGHAGPARRRAAECRAHARLRAGDQGHPRGERRRRSAARRRPRRAADAVRAQEARASTSATASKSCSTRARSRARTRSCCSTSRPRWSTASTT